MYCQTVVFPPIPTGGFVGAAAKFFCEVDFQGETEYMEWLYGSDTIYYYKDGNEAYPDGRGQYEANREGNLFNLTIKHLKLSNAGRYGCKVLGRTGPVSRYAELIVHGE